MKDNLSAYNSNDYDSRVNSVLPYYGEFHRQIIDLVKAIYPDNAEISWLDTGCGTGSLAFKAEEQINNIKFTLCDPSDQMLEKAKEKLNAYQNIVYKNISSQQLDYENKFDVVTAVQSHHYLNAEQRKEATQNCFRALKSGGIYITFENIMLSDEISDRIGNERWKNYLRSYGKTETEVQSHINRRGTEVFPITIEEHLRLLKSCGFETADILWASYMQAGFFAIKKGI